jgi:hypothetical protein
MENFKCISDVLHFEVVELEERLENKWGCGTTTTTVDSCTGKTCTTYSNDGC